jgi:phasin family protein
MSDRHAPEYAAFDAYRTAFAPFIAFQQESLKAFSRLAHYQYAVAGDYLELGLKYAKTSLAAKSAQELVEQQTEFGTRLSEQVQKRGQELLKIATESQAAMTNLFADSAAKVAETATKKAA